MPDAERISDIQGNETARRLLQEKCAALRMSSKVAAEKKTGEVSPSPVCAAG
jgi:hypothetical protein